MRHTYAVVLRRGYEHHELTGEGNMKVLDLILVDGSLSVLCEREQSYTSFGGGGSSPQDTFPIVRVVLVTIGRDVPDGYTYRGQCHDQMLYVMGDAS